MNILFVCTGNVCRSFAAEKIFNHLAGKNCASLGGQNPPRHFAKSCGVGAEAHFQPPKEALDFLSAMSIADLNHRPQYFSEELINWADIIFAMESWQADIIAEKFPQSFKKTHLLLKYCLPLSAEKNPDIPDPVGHDVQYHLKILSQIKDCVSELIKKLQ
ncbi:MAG: hypothetical protein NTW04_04205 [Elusimicrobia bacterium]|nr:hypothetical protein [Elusimicrobiota bacterium]